MAYIPATLPFPGLVTMLADRTGLKAGGTDGFAAPRLWPQWFAGASPFDLAKLRKAHRHGGAIPWSMVREITNPVGWEIPPPTDVDAHYVSEVVGYGDSSGPFLSTTWFDYWYGGCELTVAGDPGGPWTVLPNTRMEAYLASPWPDIANRLARPFPPTMSADDPYLDPPTADHLTHGVRGEAVVGRMRAMHLIRPTANDLNDRTVGAQSQYFVEIPCNPGPVSGDYAPWVRLTGFDGSDWTTEGPIAGSTYWAFGVGLGGWTYAVTLDPETGTVAAAWPMPEGRVREGYMFGPYLSNFSSYPPRFWAISWPTGIRALTGDWFIPSGDTYGKPKIMWRLARPWSFRCRTEPSSDPWNGPPDYLPYAGPLSLWRGYEPIDDYDARNGLGDWHELCTFNDWTGSSLGEPTWGTLPDPGDEVILTIFQADDFNYPSDGAYVRLVPEATVSPVAIPRMFGGVIQGGGL